MSPADQPALDPVALARDLIRCPSVTPVDAGALDVLERALTAIGFRCRRLTFGAAEDPPVDNLYARLGTGAPNFCFAGHTDVVPAGDRAAWSVGPFAAEIRDGRLFGRGAADMKSAIACFAAAADRFHRGRGESLPGSISFLVTGDEEGPAINGTRKVLDWLAAQGERLDGCLVGEPTNPRALGEMVKVGRRGSLNAWIAVAGVQGHAAYPENADNPIPKLVKILAAVLDSRLDDGSADFQPSTVTVTSVDVGNTATNVIPAAARATLNIRFNDRHDAGSLRQWLDLRCRAAADRYTLRIECSGEAFVTAPGRLRRLVVEAVARRTGLEPIASTSGGTSDARFIKDVCPVIEFGMVGETAHKVDENVAVDDIHTLTAIYLDVLEGFFGGDR
jgi:succinyl-diaminopimelate desuccinylase